MLPCWIGIFRRIERDDFSGRIRSTTRERFLVVANLIFGIAMEVEIDVLETWGERKEFVCRFEMFCSISSGDVFGNFGELRGILCAFV